MSSAIVCIGGGGFLMDDARLLQERYLLSLLARQERPRVVYLGTAAGDAERAQLRFVQAFLKLGCEPRTLPFFPYNMGLDYAAEVAAADLVYVGGGNTVAMLAVWREFEFDTALRRAGDAGTVFAGISAGANCWFERYITDSIPGGGEREGLGWLSGTFCPHLGAWAAEGGARAGESCRANLGAGEACGGPTQRAGNNEWPGKSPRPEGLGLKRGPCVVATLARASSPCCAPRLACAPFQAQRGHRLLPPRLLDSEAWRQPLLAKANRMPAFGTPDSVLLRFDDARLTEAVCDKPGLAAFQRGADGTLEALPTRLLSGS